MFLELNSTYAIIDLVYWELHKPLTIMKPLGSEPDL